MLGMQKEVFLQSKSPVGVFLRRVGRDRHPVFSKLQLDCSCEVGCFRFNSFTIEAYILRCDCPSSLEGPEKIVLRGGNKSLKDLLIRYAEAHRP